MHIAILGRQPTLGMAELESIYSDTARWFSDTSALINADSFSIDTLGGTQKAGRVVAELQGDWRQASAKILQTYTKKWAQNEGKITLGISAYGFTISAREVQKAGIVLKQKLKASGVSLRLVPNAEPALNTATSHHNKLGLAANKVELLVVRNRAGKIIISESIGAQNITAYTKRDQQRPKRDAFVGMLPPKLAQIMINLAAGGDGETPAGKYLRSPGSSSALTRKSHSSIVTSKHLQPETEPTSGLDVGLGAKPFASDDTGSGEHHSNKPRLLDPFCGTGVILQEAALQGYAVYGTDLSEKMIDYTQANLEWLAQTHRIAISPTLHPADARTATWQQPVNLVVCEGYLGQPFSAPPSPSKLAEVRGNCNQIMGDFLQNIASQLSPGTSLCVGVPAWRTTDGSFTHLPLINSLEQFGYSRHNFNNIKDTDLLYYREDQVVARELLVLVKT